MREAAGDVDAIERAAFELGAEILANLRAVESDLTDVAFWEEKILDFCMEHPGLKTELFRFIDVLPVLRPAAVSEHLVEYLGHVKGDLPPLLRFTMDVASPRGAFGRLAARAARQNVQRMARRFIAGSTPGEAIAAIRRLRRDRMAVTLDVLGEAVVTDQEAEAYTDQYLSLLRETSRVVNRLPEDPLIDRDHRGDALPRVNVSLKLSALTAIFDPIDPEGTVNVVVPRLRRILSVASEVNGFVHVDMEHYERKDLTLRIFEEAMGAPGFRESPHVGIVLQAYLKDAERDVTRLADFARRRGTPIWVRLVKGAYWDYETVVAAQRGWPTPVWQEKWESDASFERCSDRLLDSADVLRPAFASHNVRSLARALAGARALKLPERLVEFQTLYGMADPVKHALVGLGQRVRVYTPYGQLIPGMAYLVRRLLENTSNESFLRHQVTDGRSVEELLAIPTPSKTERLEVPMSTEAERTRSASVFENEPLLDFSSEKERDAFAEAIGRVRDSLGTYCPVTIAGKPFETARRIESECPSNVAITVGTSGAADVELADRAIAAAKAGLAEWRRRSVEERARALDATAEAMRARRNELAAWICFEAGKPWRDADAEVAEAIDFCRYYAAAARDLALPERVAVPGEENVTVHAPRGVAVVISPWNFPMAIPGGMTAAALVMGNTVVLKPAEQTPVCAHLLFNCFLEGGVPPAALHYVPGYGEVVGARLVEHPDTALIAFTGSRAVGHAIARRAVETSTGLSGIKRVVAEMGGKNAIIVDDDCDLDEAVPGVLSSAFGYAGQKCSAASRVLVLDRVYERFMLRLAQAAEALVIGPGDDPATAVGPLIDRESVERVRRYLETGARSGRVVFQSKLRASLGEGHFAPPTVFEGLPADSPLLSEEIFGPVLAVVRARDFDEALTVANATEYALTGGLYSRSPGNIERARAELEVGNLYINRKITGALVSRQPFGGFRHSGTGTKAGGRDYLREFVVSRTVCENTLRRGFAPPERAPI